MSGFSHRPPPSKTSQSTRQRSDLPAPDCIVFRVGWYMRTDRWRSSAEIGIDIYETRKGYFEHTRSPADHICNHNIANRLNDYRTWLLFLLDSCRSVCRNIAGELCGFKRLRNPQDSGGLSSSPKRHDFQCRVLLYRVL